MAETLIPNAHQLLIKEGMMHKPKLTALKFVNQFILTATLPTAVLASGGTTSLRTTQATVVSMGQRTGCETPRRT